MSHKRIPIKMKACWGWDGSVAPAAVAGKRMADEAAARGLLDDSRAPVARTRVDAPAGTQGLAVTRLTDRWAAMQVATVRFAHRCERPLSTSSRQRGLASSALQLVILGLPRA